MRKIRAFTLLESLLGLLVMSLSVLVIAGLTRLFAQNLTQLNQENGDRQDWLIFCQQFSSELSQENFVKVQQNQLFVTSHSQQNLRYGLVHSDFRKTNAQGLGYQPMLFDLATVKMSEKDQLIRLEVRFQNGEERVFCYQFSKTN